MRYINVYKDHRAKLQQQFNSRSTVRKNPTLRHEKFSYLTRRSGQRVASTHEALEIVPENVTTAEPLPELPEYSDEIEDKISKESHKLPLNFKSVVHQRVIATNIRNSAVQCFTYAF